MPLFPCIPGWTEAVTAQPLQLMVEEFRTAAACGDQRHYRCLDRWRQSWPSTNHGTEILLTFFVIRRQTVRTIPANITANTIVQLL